MQQAERTFAIQPAVRKAVPLWVGIAGPSGGGKTYSALRLATGMQRVTGGDIVVIDTESLRALHYADIFKFQHMPFEAPFSPNDYLTAITTAVRSGAKIIVLDSGSHEHEGSGGVLEWHDRELDAMGGGEKNSFRAWGKPKAARRRLINTMLQMPVSFVLCFRAQEKVKPEKGSKELLQLGWMPIAPQSWIFECTAMALLLPGANGVPVWNPEGLGERQFVKLPEQFKHVFAERGPLNEDIGEQLARWAAGGGSPASDSRVSAVTEMIDKYDECVSVAELEDLEGLRTIIWPKATRGEKERLKAAKDRAQARLDEGAKA